MKVLCCYLHDARPAPADRGAVIILAGRHVLVESGLHDLGSCATSVVPEMGGGRRAKIPLSKVVVGPDSIHTLPRAIW
jgi:hypothetical protein